jgi:phosphoribosylanthranilate isomerase
VTQIKICGITNEEDALFAAGSGASALGFIFYPSSPRYIKPDAARKIIQKLPPNLVTVGVFVNESAEDVQKIFTDCGFDMIQLHGDESPEYCRQFPQARLIKAVELKNETDLQRAESYPVTAILVDSRHAGLYGGTGKIANWELAGRLKRKKPLILSGGITEINVAEALQTVAPAALDINSGVEIQPGKKDPVRLKRIFDVIRQGNAKQNFTQIIFSKRGRP